MYNYNLKSMSCVVCLGLGFSSVLEFGDSRFVFCHERMVGVLYQFHVLLCCFLFEHRAFDLLSLAVCYCHVHCVV